MKREKILSRLLLAVAALWVWPFEIAAEDDTSGNSRFTSRFSIEAGGAYVPGTSDFFRGQNNRAACIDASFSGHLKYSFSFPEKSEQWRECPGAYQGVGLGMFGFAKGDVLGTPVALYVFQGAPFLRMLGGRFTVGYEWNFGASFGWKHHDPETDPYNIVGTSTNAYINLGLRFGYRLSPQWGLSLALEGSHFSNGNTTLPNSGVNTVGFRLGVTYTPGGEPVSDKWTLLPWTPRFSYDLMAYGGWRRRTYNFNGIEEPLPGKFGVAGLTFAPMYDFHRMFRAGVGLDLQYDESAALEKYPADDTYGDPLFYRPPFMKSVAAGLSARAELVMPIFSVGVGLGYNVLGSVGSKRFYQMLTLKTYIAGDLFLNVGYKLHDFKTPSNLMLGLGYRFHSGR